MTRRSSSISTPSATSTGTSREWGRCWRRLDGEREDRLFRTSLRNPHLSQKTRERAPTSTPWTAVRLVRPFLGLRSGSRFDTMLDGHELAGYELARNEK